MSTDEQCEASNAAQPGQAAESAAAAGDNLLAPSPAALDARLALRLSVIERVRAGAADLSDPLAALARLAIADLQDRSARCGAAADARFLHGPRLGSFNDDAFERLPEVTPFWKLSLELDRQTERLARLCEERRRRDEAKRNPFAAPVRTVRRDAREELDACESFDRAFEAATGRRPVDHYPVDHDPTVASQSRTRDAEQLDLYASSDRRRRKKRRSR